MENLIIAAFITGLTAGGLSCFAVQGGLLSGSIARQVEANLASNPAAQPAGKKSGAPASKSSRAAKFHAAPASGTAGISGMISPILLFMTAKLVAYTVLGFLLGLLGSVFDFSPMVKGFIQLAIGIFLIGNALRMFNVHPIFRYFTFEPPSAVTRKLRRMSKNGDAWITPLFLGALTVLIPCGVTQAVMAIAIGTADPFLGAVILFAFVLGTSPTFVGISWIATRLGSMFNKWFYPATAAIVLLLGLYTLDGGLTLVGSPVSMARLLRPAPSAAVAPGAVQPVEPSAPISSSALNNVVRIDVQNTGYSPDEILLPADQSIELHLVTDQVHSCSRAFYIPDLDIMEMLPETGEIVVTLPAQASGTVMQFMCSMGMYGGWFQFQ